MAALSNWEETINTCNLYFPLHCAVSVAGLSEDEVPTGGIGLDGIHDDFITRHILEKRDNHNVNISMVIDSNVALIQHFSKMGQSKDVNASINLEFVNSMLSNGADVNVTDKMGQTILHEVRIFYFFCNFVVETTA